MFLTDGCNLRAVAHRKRLSIIGGDNQFIGFVLGIAFTLGLFLMDKVLFFVPTALVGLFEFLSIDAHYHSMIRGVVDTRDLIYYFSLIALGVLLASRSLSRRKWN